MRLLRELTKEPSKLVQISYVKTGAISGFYKVEQGHIEDEVFVCDHRADSYTIEDAVCLVESAYSGRV